MKITLYTNSSNEDYLTKSLTPLGEIDCYIKGDCNVLNPVVELDSNSVPYWSRANYAYIDTFERYYNASITLTTAGLLVANCSVDYLSSWASYIRQLKCTILRQENNYSPYFQDSNLAKRVNRKYVYKQLGKLPSGQTNILTVDGGNTNV